MLLVAALPLMLGMAVFALEFTLLRAERSALGHVAESAAHAGAASLLRAPDDAAAAEDAARTNAQLNGAVEDGISVEVTIALDVSRVGVVARKTWTGSTFLAEVAGLPSLDLSAESVAVVDAELDPPRVRLVDSPVLDE